MTLNDQSDPSQTVQSFHRQVRVFGTSQTSARGTNRQWLLQPFLFYPSCSDEGTK